MNDPWIKTVCIRFRHNRLSFFIISQEDYELPKKTIRANGNIYNIFKPNNCRHVQNLYRDKRSMNMTLNEIKIVTSNCWNGKYQPITIDMTKDHYSGSYRLRLHSFFVPDSFPS